MSALEPAEFSESGANKRVKPTPYCARSSALRFGLIPAQYGPAYAQRWLIVALTPRLPHVSVTTPSMKRINWNPEKNREIIENPADARTPRG